MTDPAIIERARIRNAITARMDELRHLHFDGTDAPEWVELQRLLRTVFPVVTAADMEAMTPGQRTALVRASIITDPADLPTGFEESIEAGARQATTARAADNGHRILLEPVRDAGWRPTCSCGWATALSHPIDKARAMGQAHKYAAAHEPAGQS